MLPFRRPKREMPPKPKWLVWMLMGFGLYALVVVSQPGSRPNESAKVMGQQMERVETNIADYKEKIFPGNPASLRLDDVEEGTGDPAVCGQKVELAYQTYLVQGNELPDGTSKEKPLRFTIGDQNVMPAIGNAVIGMKAGGKRSVIAPPLMSYGLEDHRRNDIPDGANVRIEMELLSAAPPLPELEMMPYRIAEVAPGGGPMVVCGTKVDSRIKVWDLTGKLIYNNKDDAAPITLTPGKGEAMLGLEQGIIGMNEGGTRLLIIPPSFQTTMGGAAPKITFPHPEGQVIMVEVTTSLTPQ